MKRSALLTLAFIVMCSVALKAQNLNKVYGAMEEEDWEVALSYLEPIMAKKKKNYEVKWLAAICHSQRYRFDKSYALFQEALPYAEDDPSFWIPYAEAYLFGGRVDDAERTLRRVNQNLLEDYAKPRYFEIFNNIQNAKLYLPQPKEIIVKNLGANVNTVGNEYSQIVTSNQRGIFFTARREGLGEVADDGEYYEQVLTADMNELDDWNKDKPLAGYASDGTFDAPIQLLNNDSTLITYREEDLFMSQLGADGVWGQREELPINTGKWEPHAFVYNNGNSIIYASDFGNNNENSDLYIVHKSADGKWSKPYFIEELNTPKKEDAPYVAEDGTLYFSSKGHDSMGGYDIFTSRLDTATGLFSKPENMGAPINLPTDDTFFTLYGKNAYFSSSRPGGYGEVDIYRVIMFNNSQIQGKVLECDNVTAVGNATISVVGQEDKYSAVTNEYGVYFMNMPIESDFTLRVERDGEVLYEKEHQIRVLFRDEFEIEQDFFIGECGRNEKEIYVKMINSFDLDPNNIPVDPPSTEGVVIPVVEEEPEPVVEEVVEAVEEVVEATADTVVEESPVAVVEEKAADPVVVAEEELIELPNVFFDFDKQNIKAEFFERLNEAAELLQRRTDLRIMVAGHTDAYGTNEYNVALGQRRYTAVFNYLKDKGVDADQMDVQTFSEDLPIASNRTVKGRAFNRRVELYFVDENGERKK
ncbi:OmpA family protein [Roseivirga sp. E12]|uniref:OmpA family protein n=1 Tax=Roseivirga sp. E12 TaxID=2819237 RepID=UPI001ABC43F5|nr:OmpA family protein [Roseivirga sp. E12]MBO3697640.1 OmpA family protein [Roseivirga sp. E12]